jgi:hypothetical protein
VCLRHQGPTKRCSEGLLPDQCLRIDGLQLTVYRDSKRVLLQTLCMLDLLIGVVTMSPNVKQAVPFFGVMDT